MEEHMKKAVDARDTAALAQALTQAAAFAPDPTWNEGETGWRGIAEAAAAKAQANDFAGARASCKVCHRAWRDRYQHEFRERPVPTSAEPAPGAPAPSLPSAPGVISGHSGARSSAAQGFGGLGESGLGRAGS